MVTDGTNLLIGLTGLLYQGEIHRCYWGLRQKPVTREVMGFQWRSNHYCFVK